MAPKEGKRFCVEHGGVQQAKEEEEERTPCPYDPKHTCYLSKLKKHMNKCNSRPKELPEYIRPGVNALDEHQEKMEVEVYPIGSVPDEVLLELVQKIERVYEEEGLECGKSVLGHPVVEEALGDAEIGANARKHLVQNSSLLKNMEEEGFFKDNVTFIEFGAGRGQLGFWVTQAVENNENCALLLIDRASHRHKSDNKLKGVSPVTTLRIRADIADVDLSKIPLLTASANDIYGVTKHLCGIATDLALRCVVNGKSNGLRMKGVAMAFCCHHRCSWSSFVGKQYLLDLGFSPNLFSALCSISSWATCGSGKPRSRMETEASDDEEEEENLNNDRYKRFGLGQEARERIGRKCKMILNQARLKYLEGFGYEGKLVYYVEQSVSPENVCIIAKCPCTIRKGTRAGKVRQPARRSSKNPRKRTSAPRSFFCQICQIEFEGVSDLSEHLRENHRDEVKFWCDSCDACFMDKRLCRQHILQHVEETHGKSVTKGLPPREEEKTKREGKHVCLVCNIKFLSLDLLNQHQNIHTGERPYKCDMCDKSYPLKLSLGKHKVIKHNPNYKPKKPMKHLQCEECGKQFAYSHSLKAHMMTHTGQKPFVCSHCGKSLSSRQTLYEHVNAIHTGNKPYTCDECYKSFVTPKILRLHKKIHLKEKPYSCKMCGKGFTQSTALLFHVRYHLGHKPFTCPHCNKGFVSVSLMKRHIRLSHDECNKELLHCPQCPETFFFKLMLKKHKKVHWPTVYSCEPCQKTFDVRSKYNRHMRGHNKSDLCCAHCGKVLSSKSSLKRHLKTHTNDNHKTIGPVMIFQQGFLDHYKCIICGKTYEKEMGLYAHITSHSQEIMSSKQYNCKVREVKTAEKRHSSNTNKENRSPRWNCEGEKAAEERQQYECEICSKKYKGKRGLKWHVRTSHGGQESKCDEVYQYECDTCKKCFRSKKLILLHLVRTHLNKGEEKMEEDKTDGAKPKKKRLKVEKPFKCDEENCQYTTSQTALLKAHKFKHNPFYKCVTCQEKLPSRQELKAHMTTHGERPYKCDQCNKCYKDKHGLGWHKKVQHDPSRLKFTCELCGKTYPFDSLLTQHINLTHAAEKQSVCDICGKNVSKTYLPMHRRTHGEKQYSCDVCQKTFLEKAYLKRHKMIHTGEKPYVCSVCGNLFRQHSTFTRHMRTHTGDRPYKCVLCENAYKTHHNLKKHYRRSGHKLV